MRYLVAAAALTLGGCATGYAEMKASVPAEEGQAFDACRVQLLARNCQIADSGIYGDTFRGQCLSDLAAQYASLRAAEERRKFLVESGCPSPIVDQALPVSR